MSQDAQQISANVEPDEPSAGPASVPLWLILLLGLLVYWGMIYLDGHGGWFNPEVFEPFTSYAQLSLSQPYDPERSYYALGEATFKESCALCHQMTGLGKADQFPPLAGSDWLLAPGPNRIGRIVLNGLNGPIRVEAASGVVSISATMAPLGGTYSDEKLAAALTYARQQWGNKASKVTPEQIKAIRAAIAGHPGQFTPEELLKIPAQ
ncbi:MAG: cytochrome c [Verrucomicrobiota bacterium]|jgi:mono/diheme cytochrome c family protein